MKTIQSVTFGKTVLLMGSAIAALGLGAGSALAQNTAAPETVIVTGTSIRGAQPVGANVITMDASTIEATAATTTQQLLTNIPSLTGFGNQGAGNDARGGLGTADASGSSSPNIHGLGASSSSTTLVLVDGHRVPLSGLSHTLVDPSIVAPDAIARVDVLPDGTSAVYGSDAAAGVVNIITKKNFSGLQFNVQAGFADAYSRETAGLSWGKAWDDGAAMLAYDYQTNSHLMVRDRPYLTNNLSARGGLNGSSFNCSPATIAASSSGTAAIFAAPYTGASIGVSTPAIGTQGSGICDTSQYQAILPSEVRHNVLAKFNQQFGTRVNISVDLGFSDHTISTPVSRGTLVATAFGPGSAPPLGAGSINPFYQNGTTKLTSEQIRYDFNDLLGPGAATKGGQLDTFLFAQADINLFGDWVATLAGTAGIDVSSSKSRGTVNASAANLALNGTSNINGAAVTSTSNSAQADQFGLGETISVTRLPLTTANALDVWDPASSNKTSAQVRAQLLDNPGASVTQQDLNDLKLTVTGSLFDLPAGPIKTALGVEYLMNNFNTGAVADPIFGAVNVNARTFHANRTDYAAFMEFRIPLVGPDMNIPLVQSFDLDVAGRHDHYSTFGDTDNPKASFSWTIVNGIRATGSYGQSFVAPAITALPAGFASSVASSTTTGNGINILSTHVNAPGSFCASGCSLTGVQGLTITGAQNSNAETAMTDTFGLTIDPGQFIPVLQGLHLQATYWTNKSKGLITTPTIANEAQVPGLQSQLLLAPPGGWTASSPALQAAIAGIPLNGVLPTTPIFFVYHNTQQNAFNILANGIDFDISYALQTATAGDFVFDLSGSDKLRFDETPYPSGASTRFLNGYNVNTTFQSLALTWRASLSWHMDPFTASVSLNFVNPYLFQTNNYPFCVTACGTALNFQHITASTPVDVHVDYNLPNDWFMGSGTNIGLTVNNLFDQKPPFYDSGLGYDPDNASPLGRIVTFSLKKKF